MIDLPACRHCGSESDLIPRRCGSPGTVCRTCRRYQIRASIARSKGTAAADRERPAQQSAPTRTQRVDPLIIVDIANRTGLSFVDAIKLFELEKMQ